MDKTVARLEQLGLELPAVAKPVAAFVPAVTANDLVFISGQTARVNGKLAMQGYVGKEYTVEQGYEAARICGLNSLAVLKQEIGSLDRVKRIVKVLGWVRSAPGFTNQALVMNGFSELMEHVFEQRGRHARSAIGTNELPSGTPVEVEMVVQIDG